MVLLQDIPEWRQAVTDVGEFDAAAVAEHVLKQVDQREQAAKLDRLECGDEARQHLRELIPYFEGANLDPNHQNWPHKGLRALAMLASVDVAQSLLGVSQQALDAAIQSRPPFRGWGWWHGLGLALRRGYALDTTARVFGLSPKALERKARFLLGPVGKGNRRTTNEEAA